jgi:hypothetical protein
MQHVFKRVAWLVPLLALLSVFTLGCDEATISPDQRAEPTPTSSPIQATAIQTPTVFTGAALVRTVRDAKSGASVLIVALDEQTPEQDADGFVDRYFTLQRADASGTLSYDLSNATIYFLQKSLVVSAPTLDPPLNVYVAGVDEYAGITDPAKAAAYDDMVPPQIEAQAQAIAGYGLAHRLVEPRTFPWKVARETETYASLLSDATSIADAPKGAQFIDPPECGNCDSGGTGSTSCSISGTSGGCSVTCSDGYYACCGSGGCYCCEGG